MIHKVFKKSFKFSKLKRFYVSEKKDFEIIQPTLKQFYAKNAYSSILTFLNDSFQINSSKEYKFYHHFHLGLAKFLQKNTKDASLSWELCLKLIDSLEGDSKEIYESFIKGIIYENKGEDANPFENIQNLTNCIIKCEKSELLDKEILLRTAHIENFKRFIFMVKKIEAFPFNNDIKTIYKALIVYSDQLLFTSMDYSGFLYYHYSKAFFKHEKSKESLSLVQKALEYSEELEKNNDKKVKVKFDTKVYSQRIELLLNMIILYYHEIEDWKSTLEYTKMLEKRENLSDSGKFQVDYSYVIYYFSQKLFEPAKEYIDRIDVDGITDIHFQENLYKMKFYIYLFNKEYSIARECMNKIKMIDLHQNEKEDDIDLKENFLETLEEYQNDKNYKMIEESYIKALSSEFEKSVQIFEKFEKNLPQSFSKVSLVLLFVSFYYRIGKQQKVLPVLYKMTKFIKSHSKEKPLTEKELLLSENLYGVCAEIEPDPKKSRILFEDLLEMIHDKNSNIYHQTLFNLGAKELEIGLVDEAIEHFKLILENSQNPELRIDCCVHLAAALQNTSNMEAESYVNQALEIARENNLEERIEDIKRSLS